MEERNRLSIECPRDPQFYTHFQWLTRNGDWILTDSSLNPHNGNILSCNETHKEVDSRWEGDDLRREEREGREERGGYLGVDKGNIDPIEWFDILQSITKLENFLSEIDKVNIRDLTTIFASEEKRREMETDSLHSTHSLVSLIGERSCGMKREEVLTSWVDWDSIQLASTFEMNTHHLLVPASSIPLQLSCSAGITIKFDLWSLRTFRCLRVGNLNLILSHTSLNTRT